MEADILKKLEGSISCPELWRLTFRKSKNDLYLVQKYGGRYFEKVGRIYILSRTMEADILKKYCSLIYFIVPIGIATHSIIMNVAFVIKTAE